MHARETRTHACTLSLPRQALPIPVPVDPIKSKKEREREAAAAKALLPKPAKPAAVEPKKEARCARVGGTTRGGHFPWQACVRRDAHACMTRLDGCMATWIAAWIAPHARSPGCIMPAHALGHDAAAAP
jgi:hypothetical protein